MAIKISGNTVIDDSRNITSSGTMSANAYIGDGSQLTNLPGGGNVLTATASGTLADGSKVIVNADGTVSVVAPVETTGPGLGTPEVFHSTTTYYASATFDSTNNRVVITYQGNGYGRAVVGTVSGTSISFGTPVVFKSDSTTDISATFDSSNGKIVVVYRDSGNSGRGTARVGTVSGTSISFGSESVFRYADSNTMSATFDSTNNKVVIAFRDQGNGGVGTAVVGTVSGTSISFGSYTAFESNQTERISATFDSSNGKVVIAYNDSINQKGEAVVGTVSGTSISFGSSVQYNSNDSGFVSAVYDSANQKVVIAYRDWNNSERGTAVVGTVSGTSISFGSPVTFGSVSGSQYPTAVYDSTNNRVVISYRDKGNSYYGTAVVGTVSGTSISFGTPVVFEFGTIQYIGATFDSASGKVVIAYNDTSNGQYGTAIVGTVDPSNNSISFGSHVIFNTDMTYWNSPIFDSTNNKVVIAYNSGTGSAGKASVFSQTGYGAVPEIGSPTVFESASISYFSATYDSTNNKVVIAYRDNGNSYYGTAVVGTVSGTSISFGTPVVFESATTQFTSTVYDSTNNKVVIAYQDNGNSSYGTAVVGTVSGTSISFGTPVVFRSANISYTSAVYDSANGKIVVAYQDGGNSDRGYTSVLTVVSGNSITYGAYRRFSGTGRVDALTTTYDSTNGKVVIAYQDGGNSSYGTAVVATVDGTENTFGSSTIFEYAGTHDLSAAYDSSNQRVVITYKDQGNSWSGTAIVGTVSGTSISFNGSPAVFASSLNGAAVVYDSSEQKVVIVYGDAGQPSDYGTVVVGTVSGDSISFGAATVFNTATTYASAIYDSTNNRTVIPYNDQGNSGYGTAVVFAQRTISTNLTAENYIGISDGAYSNGQTATVQLIGSVDDAQSSLTPGQKYYVQNDGTLSTTADTPSVLAGTAIASTKLLIKK